MTRKMTSDLDCPRCKRPALIICVGNVYWTCYPRCRMRAIFSVFTGQWTGQTPEEEAASRQALEQYAI